MNAIKKNAAKSSARSPSTLEALPPRAPDPGRAEEVSRTAYFLAEKRGFEPGAELQDWLQAEAIVTGKTPEF